MARMSSCHMCALFTALLLLLVSIGLIVTSVVTDFWYKASNDSNNATVKRDFNYHFGMWRKCYENGIPTFEPAENRQGDCVFTYKDMVKRAEDNMPWEDYRYLSLERSWVALMITAGGLELFTIIVLIFGLWPGDCKAIRRSSIYLIAAVMSLLGAMAAIASGICFIALRDIDETSRKIYPNEVDRDYSWSFILAWVGTGLVLIQGFIFLCLLRMDYDDVGETNQYKSMYG